MLSLSNTTYPIKFGLHSASNSFNNEWHRAYSYIQNGNIGDRVGFYEAATGPQYHAVLNDSQGADFDKALQNQQPGLIVIEKRYA